MLWVLLVISVCILVVMVGRAHSRYLDRLEAESTWISFNDRKLRVVRQPADGIDKG